MDLWRIARKVLASFFKLAERRTPGPDGKTIPEFPGAAFLRFIVEWANEHGRMPSFVYQQYLRNPKDFQLLASFRDYKAAKEEEEIKKAKNKNA